MTSLSFVIPTYNAASSLALSLAALNQHCTAGGERHEVIVVDDGSTDETAEVVGRAQRVMPHLRSASRPRDQLSCRARARNIGARAAQGRTLVFLDSGVLATRALVRRAAQLSPAIGLCRTLGLFAPPNALSLDEEGALDLVARAESLGESAEWQDVREPYLDAFEANPSVLPAAWLLAWSCALVVPREQALAIGGFDERYLGWGVEDVDFGARLHREGLRIEWLKEATAVHLPHHRSTRSPEEHARNAHMLHVKLRTRESELYAVWQDGFAVNVFAARLDQLYLSALAPKYDWRTACAPMLGRASVERVICSGLDWSLDLGNLAPSTVLVHTPALTQRLERRFPGASVECLLGVALPHREDEFELAVLGDLLRVFPPELCARHLREMTRVARRVLLVLSRGRGHEERYRALSAWPWSRAEQVLELARRSGLKIESTNNAGETTQAMLVCVGH